MSNQKILLRGRLRGQQLQHLETLLDMRYTPVELANHLGISQRQIYRAYRHLGMPCEIDDKKHIKVNGREFCAWYKLTYTQKLSEGELYCVSCKNVVPKPPIPKERKQTGSYVYNVYVCPNCGRKISHSVTNKRVA